jgi:hypothetical protein
MSMGVAVDWVSQIRAASQGVEVWIQRTDPGRWQLPGGTAWTNQDLLGHLAAWSDLLVDQIEALRDDCPDAIAPVDVDDWNAVQVARRRGQAPDEIVEEWRRAVRRVTDVVSGLPAEDWSRYWLVAWSNEPVSIDRLLGLWLVHLEQHRSSMVEDRESGPSRPRLADR